MAFVLGNKAFAENAKKFNTRYHNTNSGYRPIFKVMEFEQQRQQPPKEYSLMNIASEQKLSPKQVAALYGISTAQLCVWRQNKQGPAYMQPVKRKVIYLLSDCEAFFNNLRVKTRQPAAASK